MTGLSSGVGPSISIVVPAQNAEAYLPALLKALEAQTLQPREIVVVDSSPSQATADLIAGWRGPIPIVFRHIGPSYPGHSRNVGVGLAKGEWIAFIDCRTLPVNDWLEAALAAAKRDDASLVRGVCISEADSGFKRLLRAATYGNESWWTLPGSLVKKSVFEQSGGLVGTVRAGEDIEWMDRMRVMGVKTSEVAAPNIRYSGFPDSLSAAIRKWYVYAIANATIEVRNRHKSLYLALFVLVLLFLAYRWNAIFASWNMQSMYYLPNVTKIAMGTVVILYVIYRGVIRPFQVKMPLGWLLPWRWLGIAFIGLCLDLAKAPGLLWGALLLLRRRLVRAPAQPS